MKNIIFSILVVIPTLLFSQKFNSFAIPTKMPDKAQIIKVVEMDDRFQAYIVFEDVGKVRSTEVQYSKLIVCEFINGTTGYTAIDEHLLTDRAYSKIVGNEIKQGKEVVGDISEAKSYEEIISMFPDLKDVTYLNVHNQQIPKEFYQSKLELPGFKNKIQGFEMAKYSLNAETKDKIKPNLATKLMNLAYDVNSNYDKIEELDLDWESSYNGEPQEKKNYWFNESNANCLSTGNLIAVNAKRLDDDKTNEYKQKEIVLFNNQGEITKRTDLNSDIPWQFEMEQAHIVKMENGDKALDYLSVCFAQNVSKKTNPNGDKTQLRNIIIDKDGHIALDHIHDMGVTFYTIDTLVTLDNHKTLIYGPAKETKTYFLIESGTESQNMYTFTLPKGINSIDLVDLIVHKNEYYLIAKNGYNGDDLVFQIKDQKSLVPVEIPQTYKENEGDDFQVFINDDERLIFLKKEKKTGILKFKFPLSSAIFYELKDGALKALTNFDEDMMVMTQYATNKNITSYKTENAYYFINMQFGLDKEGTMRVRDTLTKMEF